MTEEIKVIPTNGTSADDVKYAKRVEEIYIDGVNVAGCEFFDNYECNIYVNEYWEPQDNTKDMCKWHENCYFKQLKSLEQENEKLKKEVKQIGSDFIKKGDYARELEQENKDLKKQIESDKGLITVGGKQQYQYLQRIDELEQENKELKAYKDINEDFKQAWDELNEKYKQLRSALEEIRRYAEERCRQKVLDKINEVLN